MPLAGGIESVQAYKVFVVTHGVARVLQKRGLANWIGPLAVSSSLRRPSLWLTSRLSPERPMVDMFSVCICPSYALSILPIRLINRGIRCEVNIYSLGQ